MYVSPCAPSGTKITFRSATFPWGRGGFLGWGELDGSRKYIGHRFFLGSSTVSCHPSFFFKKPFHRWPPDHLFLVISCFWSWCVRDMLSVAQGDCWSLHSWGFTIDSLHSGSQFLGGIFQKRGRFVGSILANKNPFHSHSSTDSWWLNQAKWRPYINSDPASLTFWGGAQLNITCWSVS